MPLSRQGGAGQLFCCNMGQDKYDFRTSKSICAGGSVLKTLNSSFKAYLFVCKCSLSPFS